MSDASTTSRAKHAIVPTSALTTIVVAIDFSDTAQRALEWAIALAKPHRARLVLVNAIEPAVSGLDMITGMNDEVRGALELPRRMAREAGIAASVEHHAGRAWKVIAATAEAHQADLIVLGTRGRSGYKRVLLGSTADRVIRTASVPVLVVHPNDAVPQRGIQSILVPVDFSEESSIATSTALRLANHAGTGPMKIVLLHSVEQLIDWPTPEMPSSMPRYWDNAEATAKRQLESIAASLRREGLTVETKVMRGFAPDIIEQHCSYGGTDLVAMGTHGRSGLDRFMIGSVAERVLPHLNCPVLVVRRPADDAPVRVAE